MKDWKKWAKCAGIRAVKTVAQTAVATIGTATVLNQVDAKLVVSASVLAGILSLLTRSIPSWGNTRSNHSRSWCRRSGCNRKRIYGS